MSDPAKSGVSRRTLAKAAAWTVPAAAVVAAAPAMAASPIPPRGLNGWVEISRWCARTYEYQIDGRGNFTGGGNNDRGIWTFVPDPNAVITDASIVFYLDTSNAIFTNSSEPGWSDLVRDAGLDSAAPAAGFYAYRTTYTGSWTYFTQYQAWGADSDPWWRWNMPDDGCSRVRAYARRTLTVNGETITFTRGPIST